MTLEMLFITMAAAVTLSDGGNNYRPVDNNHFLIYGDLVEVDPVVMEEKDAKDTQVIIYQDDEIYVAFNSDEKGKYLFNLPVDHKYRIVYGGEKFVNKIIDIDANNLPKKKYGHKVELDMGMVKEYEGVDYEFLKEPVASLSFNPEVGDMIPDFKQSKKQSKNMFKCIKEIAKKAR